MKKEKVKLAMFCAHIPADMLAALTRIGAARTIATGKYVSRSEVAREFLAAGIRDNDTRID